MFYGELKFILGYTAAGTEFQWIYTGKNGPRTCVQYVDVSTYRITLIALLFFTQRRLWLPAFEENGRLSNVAGRRAPCFLNKNHRIKRGRILHFYADTVVKHTRDFCCHSADQWTSLPEIQSAYGAAKGCRFLPQAVTGPTVSVDGTCRVQCSPPGCACSLKSEQDRRWMAKCVCQALCILQDAGVVHRDI